jgi:hypothetical protein
MAVLAVMSKKKILKKIKIVHKSKDADKATL